MRMLAVVGGAVIVAGAAGASTKPPRAPACAVAPAPPTTVGELAGAVVQRSDLPPGWRLERSYGLPKGTSADGPSSQRLGGAVTFAREVGGHALVLTSSAELEPSAAAACRTYRAWLHALLGAGVGTRLRPVGLGLGRERALLDSNEAAFGPMVTVSWYRGAVYAEVEVQFRTGAAAIAAHRTALRLAAASDARLRRILG